MIKKLTPLSTQTNLITDILPQKKKKDRYNLYLNNEFYCGISEETLAKFYLYKGKELSPEDLTEIIKNELRTLLFNKTLGYTSRALKPEKEVLRYLERLFYKYKDEFAIEEVESLFSKYSGEIIEELRRYNLIDDRRYAEEFIDARLKNRPRAGRLIELELARKGIGRDIIQEVLEEKSIDETALIRQLLMKKFKCERISLKDRKKIQFLQGKGFSWDSIEPLTHSEDEE